MLEKVLRAPGGNEAKQERAAQALTQLDRTHEEAQRFLIARFADAGNISAALRQYNELWHLLGDPGPDRQDQGRPLWRG